ncbi:MAG: hypothetical protein Q4F49_04345 [Pseudoxanthomonas suwonensis]|nr:hypothetical protein [Pseudoxanthomonas suwonensis]
MRQIFASPRLENAEAVAALLQGHGIETLIRNGRGWRGAIRGNFSYRDKARPREVPTVWVVRSADQPEARRLLREAGLLADGRDRDSYLSPTVHGGKGGRGYRNPLRIMLLVAAVLVVGMVWLRNQPPSRPAASPDAPVPGPANDLMVATTPAPYPAAMPTALAALLADEARAGAPACVAIDGNDPDVQWLSRWPDAALSALSDCPDDRPRIRIDRYVTDGSGIGTARVHTVLPGATDGTTRLLRVERRGNEWRILGQADDAAAN